MGKTEYVIKAMYQTHKNPPYDYEQKIWSKKSKPIAFCTLDDSRSESGKAALITSFWFRTIIKNHLLSHCYLVDVIVEFLVPHFRWNPARKHDKLTLSNYGQTLSVSEHGPLAVRSVLSQNAISAQTAAGRIVRWEIKMKKKQIMLRKEPAQPYEFLTGFEVGYIAAEHINEVNVDSQIGAHGYAVAFGLANGQPFHLWLNGRCSGYTKKGLHFWQENDRIEFQFDFETSYCTAYHNGNYINQVTFHHSFAHEIPKEFEFYLFATMAAVNCVFDARLFH